MKSKDQIELEFFGLGLVLLVLVECLRVKWHNFLRMESQIKDTKIIMRKLKVSYSKDESSRSFSVRVKSPLRIWMWQKIFLRVCV